MTQATAALKVAILLTCRNRRETTLTALRQIALQDPVIQPSIFLFDDASTDGTPEAVGAEFPEVRIVHGDGNAFWNGGLHRVWTVAREAPVAAFLWLNDDVELERDAFVRLAAGWRSMRERCGKELFILASATRGNEGEISYGGMRMTSRRTAFHLASVEPGEELKPIDTFNGNIVLVPRAVVDRIGLNDPAFHHNLGDIDYGLRATKAGICVLLLPGTLGRCDANEQKRRLSFGSQTLTLREQWRTVNTHRGLPVASWWRLTRRHSGKWWLIHFLGPYRALVRPSLLSSKKERE